MDRQLLAVGNILRKMHVKYINVGDVSISDNIKAYNVKLGDVTRIKRKGDAYLWTGADTINNKAAVGIDKLDLLMDTLELNGKTYRKVLVVVYSNMLSFKTSVYTTRTTCNQTLSDLRLSGVTGVMLYSRPTTKMNITSLFLKEVVPFVNDRISSESFVEFLLKYFDSCSGDPTGNFLDLIAKRFGDDETASSNDGKGTRQADQRPLDADEIFLDYLLEKLEVRLKEKIDSALQKYREELAIDNNEENKKAMPPDVSLL